MYYQLAGVTDSRDLFQSISASAAAAACHVLLCRSALRIFNINCPSAVVVDRNELRSAGLTVVENDPRIPVPLQTVRDEDALASVVIARGATGQKFLNLAGSGSCRIRILPR